MIYQIVWMWALLECMLTTLMLPFLQLLYLILSPKSIVTWWPHNEHSYRRRPNKPKQSKQISRAYHLWKSLVEDPHSWNPQRALKQVRPFVSMHAAIKIYKGLIEPHFDYCSAVWDGLTQQLSEKLQKLQNRTIRVITKSSYDISSRFLLNSLGWDN